MSRELMSLPIVKPASSLRELITSANSGFGNIPFGVATNADGAPGSETLARAI